MEPARDPTPWGAWSVRHIQCTLPLLSEKACPSYLENTKVRSSGLRTGPTFMRTRSPSAPASTGHGV